MYFSIYDIQTQSYLYSGRNSKTKHEAIEAGIEYLTGDWNDEDINNLPENEYEEILIGYEFQIHEHKNKLPDFNY